MRASSIAGAFAISGLLLSGTAFAVSRVQGQSAVNLQRQNVVFRTSAPTIKSANDLKKYLLTTAKSGSPLDRLSPDARARFLTSLTFNDRGLTGFRFVDLRDELPPTQIYQILSLFGQQQDTSLIKGARILNSTDRAIVSVVPVCGPDGCDYPGYYCRARATCSRSDTEICTRHC